MYETFDTPFYLQRSIEVHYTPFTAEWQISGKNVVGQNNVAAYSTYGTGRANAYKILEDSLNLRDVRIYDTVEDADGKERRVLNAKETTLAAQKQQAIRDAFRDWIWRDPERRQALVRQYNEEMNATRPREYDGSQEELIRHLEKETKSLIFPKGDKYLVAIHEASMSRAMQLEELYLKPPSRERHQAR